MQMYQENVCRKIFNSVKFFLFSFNCWNYFAVSKKKKNEILFHFPHKNRMNKKVNVKAGALI